MLLQATLEPSAPFFVNQVAPGNRIYFRPTGKSFYGGPLGVNLQTVFT